MCESAILNSRDDTWGRQSLKCPFVHRTDCRRAIEPRRHASESRGFGGLPQHPCKELHNNRRPFVTMFSREGSSPLQEAQLLQVLRCRLYLCLTHRPAKSGSKLYKVSLRRFSVLLTEHKIGLRSNG